MPRRHHYPRESERLMLRRQLASPPPAVAVKTASDAAAATETVDALNTAIGGDIGQLNQTLTDLNQRVQQLENPQ